MRGIIEIYHMLGLRQQGELISRIEDDRDEGSYSVDGVATCELLANSIWEHYTKNGYRVNVNWFPKTDTITIKKLDDKVRILRNMKRRITIKAKKIRKNGIGLFDDYEYAQITAFEKNRAIKLLNQHNISCEVTGNLFENPELFGDL